jgi:DNA-binding MarR family transcriptional regulator
MRQRRDELERELADLHARLQVLDTANRDQTLPVPHRVRIFLGQHPSMTFHARELADAIAATDATVRKALSMLTQAGFVIRAGGGIYGIDPITGPLDAESARLLRGWEDP